MDPEQLGRLLDKHSAVLELYARQWCDSPEDVVQEAFLKLTSQNPSPGNPAAWLFRVVRNQAIDASIAARRRRRHEAGAAGTSVWFEAAPGGHSLAIDPEHAADSLRTLPIEEREVIVAHLWGGLTFEQIAELSGGSSSAAHRLYVSGLMTLRKQLGIPCLKSRQTPN